MRFFMIVLFSLFIQSCTDSKINAVQDMEVGKSGKSLVDVADGNVYIKDAKWEIVGEERGRTIVKFSAHYDIERCVDDMISMVQDGYTPNKTDLKSNLPSYDYLIFNGISHLFNVKDEFRGELERRIRVDERMHNLEIVVEFAVSENNSVQVSSQYWTTNGKRFETKISGYFPEMLNGNIPQTVLSAAEMVKKDYINQLSAEKEKRRAEEQVANANSLFSTVKSKFIGEWIYIKSVSRDTSNNRIVYDFDVVKIDMSENNSLILNVFEYKIQTDRFLLSLLECEYREKQDNLKKNIGGMWGTYSDEVRDGLVKKANAEIDELTVKINEISAPPYRIIEKKHLVADKVLNFEAVNPADFNELRFFENVYISDLIPELNGLQCCFGVKQFVDSVSFFNPTNKKIEINLAKKEMLKDVDGKIYACRGYTEYDVEKIFFYDIIQNFDYNGDVK